ncbi:MAG: dimethylarginine dimethylaminohydrolase family protein [Acidobacteriota bacterium]
MSLKPIENRDEWLADETSMRDELPDYWGGDWGCDSEVGALRAVLLRRPGAEIEGVEDPGACRWLQLMDPAKARDQHDALAGVYRAHGVTVHYLEQMRDDKPNALFLRDSVLMTPEGAIVGRQAMACRRGEERFVAEALARLGVPILRTVSGTGIFETACCLWIDAATVLMGSGNRANREGCRQVEEALRQIGVERFLQLQIPFGYAHIDGIVTFVDKRLAIVDPHHIPWDTLNSLRETGLRVLEAPATEELPGLSLNGVALSPGHIVMASGNPATRRFIEDQGVQVTEVDVSELLKAWGSIHCMTGVLKRDAVGKLF